MPHLVPRVEGAASGAAGLRRVRSLRAAAATSLAPLPDFLAAKTAGRLEPGNRDPGAPRKRRQFGARAWGPKGRMREERGHRRGGGGAGVRTALRA